MIAQRIRAAALCLSMLAAASCSMLVDKNTHTYPQASKDSFMKSCVSGSGGQETVCKCMFDKVQQKYTYGEAEELEKKIQKGEQSPEFTEFMVEARDSCVKGPSSVTNTGQR